MEIKETSKRKNLIESKYKLFDLSEEEKKVFMMAVNKLSAKVYKRGEKNSSNFLTAIDHNNTIDAMASFMELSWRGIALKILYNVHAIHKVEDESYIEEYIERIYSDAAKYKEEDTENIKCPRCEAFIKKDSEACDSCGALIYEI